MAGGSEFKFGSEDQKLVHRLVFAISPKVPDGQMVRPQPGSLVGGKHDFPGSNISVGWRLSKNRRMLTLDVGLDPRGVRPGRYEGELPLFVGGAVRRSIHLKATLRSRIGSEFWTAALAFGAILIGASAGAILKWLAEKATKLGALRARYKGAMGDVGRSRLPSGLRGSFRSMRDEINAGDVNAAETQWKKIEPKLDEMLIESRALDDAWRELDGQKSAIDDLKDLSPEQTADLKRVYRHARARLESAVDRLWTDEKPGEGRADRDEVSTYIRLFSKFLGALFHGQKRELLLSAMNSLLDDDVASVKSVIRHWQGETSTPHGPALPQEVKNALDKPGGFAEKTKRFREELIQNVRPWSVFWWRDWSIDNAGFVLGIIIAAFVSLVGMTLLYFPKDTFGGDQDWVQLILWGFGIQLAGFNIAQLGGRALGSGPRLVE